MAGELSLNETRKQKNKIKMKTHLSHYSDSIAINLIYRINIILLINRVHFSFFFFSLCVLLMCTMIARLIMH